MAGHLLMELIQDVFLEKGFGAMRESLYDRGAQHP